MFSPSFQAWAYFNRELLQIDCLHESFATYLIRDLFRPRLIFARINGPIVLSYCKYSIILRLVSLQFLSANKNKLRGVPDEICHLTTLTDLHLADNSIERYITPQIQGVQSESYVCAT
jgi:hypothetical protein